MPSVTSHSETMSPIQSGSEHDLLLTLEEISQVVSHSHDLRQTLDNICLLIQKRFRVAVCSLYLFDPKGVHLVLAASVGLRPEGIGRVRMRLGEGLTGLVAETVSPVNEPNAPTHPRFKYFPEAGEDPFQSFLGVPLLVGGTVKGVLVVQAIESRTFSPGDVRMLKTVAAQLSSLVTDAWWLEQLNAFTHGDMPMEQPMGPIQGVGLSPGVGAGLAYVLDSWETYRQKAPKRAEDSQGERARLQQAIAEAREELKRQEIDIANLVGEDHGAILQAQRMILQDRSIERDLLACINKGSSAEAAILDTLDHYVAAYGKVATAVLQERVYDIKDVFHRVLWHLVGGRSDKPAADLPVILVTREASVMELFAVERSHLAGVVVEHGGPQSHAACPWWARWKISPGWPNRAGGWGSMAPPDWWIPMPHPRTRRPQPAGWTIYPPWPRPPNGLEPPRWRRTSTCCARWSPPCAMAQPVWASSAANSSSWPADRCPPRRSRSASTRSW